MKRRGLSTIVGAVFFVLVMGSTIGYVTYSMDVIDDLAYQVDVKQDTNLNRQNEEFKITDVTVDGNEFNLTVTNTGTIPINITNMWAKNMTDPSWNQTKYKLNKLISPGQSVSNIGQSTGLIALDSQSYSLRLVTTRGSTLGTQILSPNDQPLDLQLYSLPPTIPDAFESTILLSVRNNMTGDRLLKNIKPVDPLTVTPNDANTIVTKIDGPTPLSYPSLKSGETALFKWTYTVDANTDDYADFTAQLENGYAGNTATTRTTIGEIKLASEAVTSFSSQGFNPLSSQSDDLVLHQENLVAPLSSAYQMDQRNADAVGLSIQMKTTSPDFYTNNGTAVQISTGIWNASLSYMSAAFPDSLSGEMDNDGGMIFHFEDVGAGIDGNEDNSSDCQDGNNADFANYEGGMSVSDWNLNGGPHGSGSYTFDGSNDFFSVERANCNEVKNDKATLAARFKADSSGSGNDYIYWAGRDGSATEERFAVKIDSTGNLVFDFKTRDGSVVTCASTGTDYRDDAWHHFVAVRDNDFSCKLYIDGNTTPISSSGGSGDEEIRVDDFVLIGARLDDKDNPDGIDFFQGSLDDVMYWQKFDMDSSEMSDLYNTNYGNKAHTVTFTFSRTDDVGVNLATITNDIAYPMNFSDGKRDSQFLKSFSYSSGVLPTTTIGEQDRLKFRMVYVDFVEALQMTLRVDDNTLTSNPRSSYVNLPIRNATFFPYNTYDNDTELQAGVTSNGPFGTWLTKSGTRAIFNSTTSDLAYGAIIKSVNGTVLSENQDSVFIAVGERVDLVFHRPKIVPDNCWPPSSPCNIDLIPPGFYHSQILMVGYNDEGFENRWIVDIGTVSVTD